MNILGKKLRFRLQQGVTLIELMVAMAIGLLLLAGLVQIYLGSKATYRLNDGMARLQENSRFAVDALQRNIVMAGYPRLRAGRPAYFAVGSPIGAPIEGTDGGTGAAAIQLISATGTSTGGYASDTITVRSEIKDPDEKDCRKNSPTVPAGFDRAVVTNVFAVNGAQELTCNGQPMIEGVENMQVLYGVDDDGNRYADRYLPASAISWTNFSASPNGNQVVSVRIALLMNTVETVRSERESKSYSLLDAAPVTLNDLASRRVVTTTIWLRNQPPRL